MDDQTIPTTTVRSTKRLLEKPHQKITVEDDIKAQQVQKYFCGERPSHRAKVSHWQAPVPKVSEMTAKSLGRWYDIKLKDTEWF